ncbi:polymorphic toxin-type HINT domain-containing protein [Pigmentibacter ruber]
MQKLNNYIKFIILILFSHLYLNIAFGEVFSSPTLSKPSAPGTFGARQLDWTVSDLGEVGYSIPIAAPALKQLSMNLSLNYSPTHAYGDAGAFWNFSLMKVSLDLKRGQTQFLTRNLCTQSMADNLNINGTKLIPQSPGVWMTSLNSGRDILKCHENGFVFYKSTGDIFHFGLTPEAISMTASGEAIEWLISKHSTFRGKQEIFYEYEKPTGQPTEFGLSNTNIPNLYAKPMLKRIYSDDVELQIQYQENTFKNLHFYGGIPQILFGRVSEISVLKNTHLLRKYVFQYEDSAKVAFPRLYSMQELGSDGKSAYPKTIFSYRGSNSTVSNELSSVNEKFDRSFPSFSDNYFKFADLLSTGKSQMLYQAGSDSFWLTSFDPTKVFAAEPNGGLVTTQKIKVRLEAYTQYSKNLKDLQFVDLMGTGTTDIYSSNGANPVILLNDRKFNEKGELIFKRYARLSRDDYDFIRQCGLDPRKWKTLNLTGQGRSDFLCIGNKNAFILINKGMKLVDAKENRYEIITKRLKVKLDYNLQSTLQDDYAIVDWNADGLSDLLINHGNSIYLLLNTGIFAKGENQSSFFEKVNLGLYRYLGGIKASKMLIGDFTGTGLPSINFKHSRFLINHGLGKPLTEIYIENIKKFNPEYAAVVQLTGTGKQQIFAATPATHGNAIIELASRSFPNHLHSVVSADGRFLSFNYTSSVLENQEAITTEQDVEVKQLEMQQPIMPVVLPLLKQIGFSDGINPTRMTRYAYRLPRFDSYLNKYLGFSLVRKQNVGDETQLGTLQEKRFLSGVRLSEVEKFSGFVDYRLQSEKNVIQHEMLQQCLNPSLTAENTQWCTDLAGFSYYQKSGAALDSLSFATGLINTKENYTLENNTFDIKFFSTSEYPSNPSLQDKKPELANVLNITEETEKSGENYLTYQKIHSKVTHVYDELGRLITTQQKNSSLLNGEDKVTNYTYFCPLSHPENLKIYCDQVSLEQVSSSLGNVKTITKKIEYDFQTGLPIENWEANQAGDLVLQESATYDQFGRLTKLKQETGEYSIFHWNNSNGNLNSIQTHNDITTEAQYNEFGNIIKLSNSKNNISEFIYDSFGRVVSYSKNQASEPQLKIVHIAQKSWDIFINWLKKVFGLGGAGNNNQLNTDNSTHIFEKYEYAFPKLEFQNGLTLEENLEHINEFDKLLPQFTTASSFTEQTVGKFSNHKVNPGYINTYRRNSIDQELTLVAKNWLSGADEVLYSASKIGVDRFSLANKASINSLGKVYKEYLNSEISFQNVLANELPNKNTFKVKSIYEFYANGEIKNQEFDEGIKQSFIQGVDYVESISPEGRRTKTILNDIGQVVTKQIGLDNQGNISNETLITNVAYDALSRIIKVTNNDGLIAEQLYAANNKVIAQTNNFLGVSQFFYDNFGRLTQNAICPVGTNIGNCNMLESSILYKQFNYDGLGNLVKEEHTRFERAKGTHAKEVIEYTYGSLKNKNRAEDIGLPIIIKVNSINELGQNESIRNYAYNSEGQISTDELELFLYKTKGSPTGLIKERKSISVYQSYQVSDFAGNVVQLKSRGGFSREHLNKLEDKYFTGYAVQYLNGISQIDKLSFLKDGKEQSVPIQGLNYDSEGYLSTVYLENNLKLKSCWHKRKEIPIAFWAGKDTENVDNLCNETNSANSGYFHTRWKYNNDLFPIETKDFSTFVDKSISLAGNSKFSYDQQGRLKSSEGFINNSIGWGKIDYSYSVGGKIEKIVRSGNFVKDRLSDGFDTLEENYHYSNQKQLGVLQSVTSRSGNQSAISKFTHDGIGYREFGVSPTLAVFTKSKNSNQTEENWTNPQQIPMQKYAWSGRGQLSGVFSGFENSKNQIEAAELLNLKMSDEKGNQLAEFDSVTLNEILATDSNKKTYETEITKLPRNVQFSNGISFERDEIHFDIQVGSFASLRLITRYPALNATNPESLSKQEMQTRKELVLKDLVGSVTQVLDIDTHKIIEKNASEPFGLNRGIPLLTNNVLSQFQTDNKRAESQLYLNPQSNMRENWDTKSYEVINLDSLNDIDKQAMRGSKSFAKGIFSASTGLHNMGVRTYDPARGLWLSPDLFIGQNFHLIFERVKEANLFQYAGNNPIAFNDPSGKLSWDNLKDKFKDAASGKVSGRGHDMSKNPGNSGGLGGKNNFSNSNSNLNSLNNQSSVVNDFLSRITWTNIYSNMGPWGPKLNYVKNYLEYNQTAQMNLKIFSDAIEISSIAMSGVGLANVAYQGITKANSIFSFFNSVAKNPGILTGQISKQLCFVAGTLVVTEAGAKEIQDIRPGDKVAAKNPETGEIEFKIVVQTFAHEEESLVTVDVGYANITSTSEHPYYVVGEGYTPAFLLSPGKQLVTTSGSTHYVIGAKFKRQKQMVYNFEVEDYHNYFVSNDGYLVHNACSGVPKKKRNAPPSPASEANGAPHTIIEKPGAQGQYTTHFGDGTWKQYRGSGKDHGNVPRPNVKESVVNIDEKTGKIFMNKPVVRPAELNEIPR